jgi:hypothetical protein
MRVDLFAWTGLRPRAGGATGGERARPRAVDGSDGRCWTVRGDRGSRLRSRLDRPKAMGRASSERRSAAISGSSGGSARTATAPQRTQSVVVACVSGPIGEQQGCLGLSPRSPGEGAADRGGVGRPPRQPPDRGVGRPPRQPPDRGVGRPPPRPPDVALRSGSDSSPVPDNRRARNPDEPYFFRASANAARRSRRFR